MSDAPAPYEFLNLESALEYLGDGQGVRDMLPLLTKALERDVPEVAQLLSKGEIAEAAAVLHSLKGFLPIFCYPSLVEDLVRMEKSCKSGSNPDLLSDYDALTWQLQGLGREVSHFESQTKE